MKMKNFEWNQDIDKTDLAEVEDIKVDVEDQI